MAGAHIYTYATSVFKKQMPEEFEGGPKDVLTAVLTGRPSAEEASIAAKVTVTNEEPIEISPITHPALVESKGSTAGTVEVIGEPGTTVRSVEAEEIPPSEPPPSGAPAVGALSYEIAAVTTGGTTTVTPQLPAGS